MWAHKRRCLHLFISGQMLVIVEIERESWGGGLHSHHSLTGEGPGTDTDYGLDLRSACGAVLS